jgi:hypothetical protein
VFAVNGDAAFARYDGVPGHASDFPFAFTKDLQPGGINHQCDFTPGGRFETDINRTLLTDTGVIRAATERSSGQKWNQ